MGLFAVLRPWLFPLGLIVEQACLEIPGLFFRSGLILRDLRLGAGLLWQVLRLLILLSVMWRRSGGSVGP